MNAESSSNSVADDMSQVSSSNLQKARIVNIDSVIMQCIAELPSKQSQCLDEEMEDEAMMKDIDELQNLEIDEKNSDLCCQVRASDSTRLRRRPINNDQADYYNLANL